MFMFAIREKGKANKSGCSNNNHNSNNKDRQSKNDETSNLTNGSACLHPLLLHLTATLSLSPFSSLVNRELSSCIERSMDKKISS